MLPTIKNLEKNKKLLEYDVSMKTALKAEIQTSSKHKIINHKCATLTETN